MPGGGFQFAIAIELVAKKIGHDDRPGCNFLYQSRQAGLVDLEEADRCRHRAVPAGAIEDRGRHAEDQVGARLVGHRRMALRLEDVAQQRGGGRLAIGPCHHDGSVGERARELGEDRWVDPARDIAREGGATAAA